MAWPGVPSRLGAASPALAGLFALLFAAGCELLTPGLGIAPDELANPSPIASYTSGSATIALGDGTKVQLTELHGKAALYKTFGATVGWEDNDGWYLQFTG